MASFLSDLTGASQAKAIRDAGQLQTGAVNRAIDTTKSLYGQAADTLSPWVTRGNEAGDALSRAFQPGGLLARQYQAPTFNFDVNSDPGAQFRIEQANNAFQRSAAAKGASMGGAAARNLSEFNQKLASTEYQNAYDRFNQDRAFDRSVFTQDQGDLFSRLFALSGQGQQSAGALAGLDTNQAQQLSELFQGLGNVQAGAKIGAANARAQGLNNLINTGLRGGAVASLFI